MGAADLDALEDVENVDDLLEMKRFVGADDDGSIGSGALELREFLLEDGKFDTFRFEINLAAFVDADRAD